VAIDWIDRAHQFEKEEFFALFPEAILNELVEVYDDHA
jgi:hypothetical protein